MTDQMQGMDSKFRLITIASKRCEQLHRGAKPRFDTESKKWSWIALEEIKRGLVKFEIIDTPIEAEAEVYEGDVFLEGDIGMPIEDAPPTVLAEDDDTESNTTKKKKSSKPLAGDESEGTDTVIDDEETIEGIDDDSDVEVLESEDDV